MEVLNKIKTRFREETFTRDNIREVILNHPELVRMLYINFAMTHCAWSRLFLPTCPLSASAC
jgi:glutamate dehydrogenase